MHTSHVISFAGLSNHRATRYGVTLLEAFIAISILFVVLAAVVSSSMSATAFSAMVDHNLQILVDAERIRTVFRDDIIHTSNFKLYDSATGKEVAGPPYRPQINDSGREMLFFKQRTSPIIGATPAAERAAYSSLKNSTIVPFDQIGNSPATPFAILNPAATGDQWYVVPTWETNRVGLTFLQNWDPTLLREYRYVLAPDGISSDTIPTGTTWVATDYPDFSAGQSPTPLYTGQLLRMYRNPGDTVWTRLGDPLATGIERATFKIDTSITNGNLSVNAVRMTADIHRYLQPGMNWPTLHQRVEITATMNQITY